MRGFEIYMRDVDPKGTWTKRQIDGMRRTYKAGWDAALKAEGAMDLKRTSFTSDATTILIYFNHQATKLVKVQGLSLDLAVDRLMEGFTLGELCEVIDYAVREWTGTQYEGAIRPSTLFRSKAKVKQYLDQADSTRPIERVEEVQKKASMPTIKR